MSERSKFEFHGELDYLLEAMVKKFSARNGYVIGDSVQSHHYVSIFRMRLKTPFEHRYRGYYSPEFDTVVPRRLPLEPLY